MFNNLFRKYNQNRKTIWVVIAFVAFFILLLHFIFNIARINRNNTIQEEPQNIQENQMDSNILNDNSIIIDTPNSTVNMTAQDIIQRFVNFCNQGQINEAYEMLTNDCKQALFPTIEDFRANYINDIFTQEKTIKVETSIYDNSILKVTFYNGNILATGGYQTEDVLQDYICVLQENDEPKLSINKFIRTEEINKSNTVNSVYVNVLKKDIYIDYEVYQIQVTNQSNNTILFLNQNIEDAVTIIDENQVRYSSNIDEYSAERLRINPQSTTIYNIRFNKLYNAQRVISAINFSDIIINYQENQTNQEAEKMNITISF